MDTEASSRQQNLSHYYKEMYMKLKNNYHDRNDQLCLSLVKEFLSSLDSSVKQDIVKKYSLEKPLNEMEKTALNCFSVSINIIDLLIETGGSEYAGKLFKYINDFFPFSKKNLIGRSIIEKILYCLCNYCSMNANEHENKLIVLTEVDIENLRQCLDGSHSQKVQIPAAIVCCFLVSSSKELVTKAKLYLETIKESFNEDIGITKSLIMLAIDWDDLKDESKEVINEKMSVESSSKRKRSKCYDIQKLEGMRDAIIKFENRKIPLRHCLLIIGKMSAGITVNGEIWEKYDCMKTGKQVSKDEVPFHKLSHFENIFYDRQIYSQITEKELAIMGKELVCLKNKLIRVLQLEQCCGDNMNASEDISPASNGSLTGIIYLSDKYFEMLIGKLTIREINKWETIDFNEKCDRYFIARLISKIGELLNELVNNLRMTEYIKDASIKKKNGNRKDSVMKAFKTLVQIRNKFVHNCSTVADGMQDRNETITDMMIAVREHLRQVFIKGSEMGDEFTINYQYEKADQFEEDAEKLLQCLRCNPFCFEPHTIELDKLIMQAYGLLIEENNFKDDGGIKKMTTINKLKDINEQYQSHLGHLNELKKIAYPKILSLETKDEIIERGNAIQNLLLNETEGIYNADELQIWIGIRKHICETLGLKLQIAIHCLSKGSIKTVIIPDGYKEFISQFESRETKIINYSETQEVLRKKIEEWHKESQEPCHEGFQYKIEVLGKEAIKFSDAPLKERKEIKKLERLKLVIHEIEYFTTDSFLILEDKLHYLVSSWMKDRWTMVANSYEDASKQLSEEMIRENRNERNKCGMVEEENIVAQATVSIAKCSDELKVLVQTYQLKYEHTEKEFKQKYPDEMQQRESRNYEGFKLKVDALCKETIEMLIGKCPIMRSGPEFESSLDHVGSTKNTTFHLQIDDSNDGEFQSSTKMKGLDHQIVIDCFIKDCEFLVCEYVEMELAEMEEMKRFDYIMQQAMSHVSQMIFDWDKSYKQKVDNNDSSIQPDEHQQVLSCFRKYAASSYSRRELQSCNRHRSASLSHKTLRFDQITFATETKGDTLSFDFLRWSQGVICHIISSVEEIFYVGFVLTKINAGKKSIQFLEKALDRAKSHPNEVEQHLLDPYYIKVFGKRRLICQINYMLIKNYDYFDWSEDSYFKLKEVIDKINEKELNQCNISEIKEMVADYYSIMGRFFIFTLPDFKEAINWYEKSDRLYETHSNKYFMGLIYLVQNDRDNFNKMLQSIKSDSLENYPVYNLFNRLLELDESKNNLSGPSASDSGRDKKVLLNDLESFIANNQSFLKRISSTVWNFIQFTMIKKDLIVLMDEIMTQGMNEDIFKQLNLSDKKFHLLKEEFKEERFSGSHNIRIYFNLSKCYSLCCVPRAAGLEKDEECLEKDRECLEKAKKYFICALKLMDSLSCLKKALIPNWKAQSTEFDSSDMFTEVANYIIHAQIRYCEKHSIKIDVNFLTDLMAEMEEDHSEFSVTLLDKIFCIFYKATVGLVDSYYSDLVILLSYNVKLEAIALCDLKLFKEWFHLYCKLPLGSLSMKQKQNLSKQKNNMTDILVNLEKVLMAILYEKGDPIQPSKFSIRFCREKWNIDCRYENQKLLLKQETESQVKDMKTELSYLEDCLLSLYL